MPIPQHVLQALDVFNASVRQRAAFDLQLAQMKEERNRWEQRRKDEEAQLKLKAEELELRKTVEAAKAERDKIRIEIDALNAETAQVNAKTAGVRAETARTRAALGPTGKPVTQRMASVADDLSKVEQRIRDEGFADAMRAGEEQVAQLPANDPQRVAFEKFRGVSSYEQLERQYQFNNGAYLRDAANWSNKQKQEYLGEQNLMLQEIKRRKAHADKYFNESPVIKAPWYVEAKKSLETGKTVTEQAEGLPVGTLSVPDSVSANLPAPGSPAPVGIPQEQLTQLATIMASDPARAAQIVKQGLTLQPTPEQKRLFKSIVVSSMGDLITPEIDAALSEE